MKANQKSADAYHFKNFFLAKVKQRHGRESSYLIRDNGGKPFLVFVKPTAVSVYTYGPIVEHDRNDEEFKMQCVIPVKLSLSGLTKVFVPKLPPVSFRREKINYSGNTLLLEKGTTYTFVGMTIFRFKSSEKITSYQSPMGNSECPYPFALSKNFVYLFSVSEFGGSVMVPRSIFAGADRKKNFDPYEIYFEHAQAKKLPDWIKPLPQYKELIGRRTEMKADEFFIALKAVYFALHW